MSEKHVADVEVRQHSDFDGFVATIEALRAVDGCPWDREQTHKTIAHNMIEEAYEAVDAIEADDVAHVREELGDVLLQVVLQSQIADDAQEFSIDDVCGDINDKIIRRHPHVFGDATAQNAPDVAGIWEKVKLDEKETADEAAANNGEDDQMPTSLLADVPTSFPALIQAQKISRKAVAAGFEWDNIDAVWDQVAEEIYELKNAYRRAPKSDDGKVLRENDQTAAHEIELEMGDVLFSLVNVARRMGIDAEESLRSACLKFRNRWTCMEDAAWESGHRIEDLETDKLEQLWQLAKETEVLT